MENPEGTTGAAGAAGASVEVTNQSLTSVSMEKPPENTAEDIKVAEQKAIDRANGILPEDPKASPEGKPGGEPINWEQRYKDNQAYNDKRYNELKEMIAGKTPQAAPEAPKPEGETEVPPTDESPEKAPEKAPAPTLINMETLQKFSQEYDSSGQLSEASLEELKQMGVAPELANSFIEGQAALGREKTSAVLGTLSSDQSKATEAYNTMTKWAAEGYTPAEQKAFNEAINSNDVTLMKNAVGVLKARYTESRGSPVVTHQPGNASFNAEPKSAGFKNALEMQSAMKDPRYKTNHAYQQEVAAKTAAMINGQNRRR